MISRSLLLILVLALAPARGFAQGGAQENAPAAARETVLRAFPAGAGPQSVGVVDASEDTEIDGPQAISAADDGTIYLLDQVNGRVLNFDAKAPERTRSLVLPEGVEPTDLVVAQGAVYVWDGKPIALEAKGGGLTRSLSEGGDDLEAARSMFAQTGSQIEDGADGRTRAIAPARARQLVATRGRGMVEAAVSLEGDGKGARLALYEKGAQKAFASLAMKAQAKFGSIEFLDVDRAGRMYALAEIIPEFAGLGAATFVARFAPGGAFEGVYELPLTPSLALSRRFVTVSPDGEVFFLRTRKGVVDVIGVGFTPMKRGEAVAARAAAVDYAALAKLGKGAIAAVRPLTRASVVETGRAFEAFTWRVGPTSYGGDPDAPCSGFNRVRRPPYLAGRAGQEVRGVPYCWGCQGSLPQFAARVAKGALAGNVCTRDAPRRDVVGVDCSSFVSAAWGLSTHFTTLAIPSITSQVADPWELKPGDALNKPGSHVMLFMGFTPDRKAEVLEASPGACQGRVCRNVYPLAALMQRGYEPRRFRALAD
ncbi:hypothetical protein [Methylocella sp.]|uniref:hypothetical protein n=1 Tax=Methylocella sp. TaxID=1978226 RepID=UPI0035ADC546